MSAPTCHRCRVKMAAGFAIAPTLSDGVPDFPGDKEAVTLSFGGPGEMVQCWKCPECGRSVEMKEPSK